MRKPNRTVVVSPPDPKWPADYESERRKIESALGSCLIRTHHIGSTSIAGIYAKPIIDLLADVTALCELDTHTREMQRLGYEVMGEYGIAGRRFFRKNDSTGIRTHHIHAFARESAELERHLEFRDFLRAHKKWAKGYSDLKRQLAQTHPCDIEAYMDGKDGFIKEVDRRAAVWKRGAVRP